MENSTQSKSELSSITISFGIASVLTIVFNTVLTIVKEMHAPLLAYMKSLTVLGVKHHWFLHGLLVIVLFALVGILFSKKSDFSATFDKYLTNTIIWVTVLGTFAITAFFVIMLFV